MNLRRGVLALLAFALAAVAATAALEAGHKDVSTTTAADSETENLMDVLYYSDLGPKTIDVSAYPAVQRQNYAVYARACSRCHGLARSINAPTASRGWWEFYMTGMRLRGRWAGRPFSREETRAVLEFLEYDSRKRKVEGSAAFEKSTETLKRRFDAVVARRMSDLQNKPQPRLNP